MADDSVLNDNESETVTRFLLNTVRLQQPTDDNLKAVAMCAAMVARHPNSDDGNDYFPLATGSVAEFYIQPMWSCVGDVDVMLRIGGQLTIPDGYPPPTQLPAEFHSRVEVFEIIDSEYPGYVYLVSSYELTENIEADKYDAIKNDWRAYSSYNQLRYENFEVHGPALRVPLHPDILFDSVPCVRCLSWPTQAAGWPRRHRNYAWPDSATVDRVVGNGCDVVRVAHRRCRQDEWMGNYQCRLSFSRAEIVLMNSWMPVQQIVYHMLRVFFKAEQLTDITDVNGSQILSNYHIKTLLLWACELKPNDWWFDDLNLVRISVGLLRMLHHMLNDWLKNEMYPHYFLDNCSVLIDIRPTSAVEVIITQLSSITESWLSTWFVDNYLRKCAQLCPDRVSRLFDDVTTSTKLQYAVSAVVNWRLNSSLEDLCRFCHRVDFYIPHTFYYSEFNFLTLRSYNYWMTQLPKFDPYFGPYITAVTFLHVAYKTIKNGLNDEYVDVLVTAVGQFVGKRRYSSQFSSILSLSQAAKLMKVVVNNSRSTVQLIEIELSKAYLYRALRCKDSDSDFIYCLANVYLAVLYYTTGQYQTAIDHCTLVTRSQDHSQCSSHVVQGELLPKIDDDIDTVLGLSVFYQYVRTAALNSQQQTQHVSVFSTELFARYLHIKCLSVMKCRQFTKKLISSTDHRFQQLIQSDLELPFVADMLCIKWTQMMAQECQYKPEQSHTCLPAINSTELDTSDLVELLQQSAVERLTTYRQLQAQKFASLITIVTTDFESLYAYKRGDYQRCLQLSTQNVRTLLYAASVANMFTFSEFIQLMDDDIVSLTALTLIVDPKCRYDGRCCQISQVTLSLYLMTQCQLKLHRSVTSLAQTLDYIEVAQRKHPVDSSLDHLALKLAERKIMIHLTSFMI